MNQAGRRIARVGCAGIVVVSAVYRVDTARRRIAGVGCAKIAIIASNWCSRADTIGTNVTRCTGTLITTRRCIVCVHALTGIRVERIFGANIAIIASCSSALIMMAYNQPVAGNAVKWSADNQGRPA